MQNLVNISISMCKCICAFGLGFRNKQPVTNFEIF